jgi:hypothetical protein
MAAREAGVLASLCALWPWPVENCVDFVLGKWGVTYYLTI